MQFSETLAAVLDGTKTETRRRKKPGQYLKVGPVNQYLIHPSGNTKWTTGQILAVQPGRTIRQVAKIKVLHLWEEDVRDIKLDSAHAEGFGNFGNASIFKFLRTYMKLNDKHAKFPDWLNILNLPLPGFRAYLHTRPDNLYHAIAMRFVLYESKKG